MCERTIEDPFVEARDRENFYELVLDHGGVRFVVFISREPLPGYDGEESVEIQHLRRLEDAGIFEDPSEELEASKRVDVVHREVRDFVRQTCASAMEEIARSTEAPTRNNELCDMSLHEYMNPKIVNLQIVTLKGQVKVIQNNTPSMSRHPPLEISLEVNISVPHFRPSDLIVLDRLSATALKVSDGTHLHCCKLSRLIAHDSIPRELTVLHTIKTLDADLKIPKLTGLVCIDDGVVGFLSEYIEAIHPNLEVALLYDSFPRERKAKWAARIRETVLRLHEIGVVWGDAKTSNILIDKNDDPWVFDLGGGQTYGWVDDDLVGTKEGDLQAVEKITHILTETNSLPVGT